MECGNGSLCCDRSFEFDFSGINPDDVEFYPVENTTIIVMTFIRDGGLYLAISFDCGLTFQEPTRLTEIDRETINGIQVLASEDQFVVGIKERIDGNDNRRAFSGKINASQLVK